MAGYDPVIATFEATTAPAIAAIADYEAALAELEATFGRVAEASGVLDERLAVAERGFQTAAVESNTLSSELTGLEERLGAAGDGAKVLASGMSNIGKSAAAAATGLDDGATAITEFAFRVDSVDEQLSTFNGRMALMGDQVIALASKFADAGTEILRSLAGINEEIAATVAAINEATASVAGFAAAQTKAASATKASSAAAAESSSVMKEVSKTLGLIGGALDLVDLGIAKMAGNFEANMNRLQTEAGLSNDSITAFAGSMSGLETKVLDIGTATGFTGTEIANALYEPVSAGLSLSKALGTVQAAAEEAKISGASLEDTSIALTATMKNFGDAAGSPEQAVASLNAIVGSGMMRFQDFNQAMKNWMPTAATFGVSLNAAGAALAYMTDRGESAQSAGTKLAQVMAMMVGQTTQAGNLMGALGLSEADVTTANEAMSGAMSAAHVTTSQLADDLRTPDGITAALKDLEMHLHAAGLNADQTNSVLVRAFGGGRQFKGLAELIQNTDQLQQKFDQIGQDSNITHFQDQWSKVSDSFNQRWADMTASLKNFMIAIGTYILPAVTAVVGAFSGMFSAIGQNKAVVDALGTAMVMLSVALPVAALVSFIKNMSDVAKATTGVALNVTVLATALTFGIQNLDSWTGWLSLAGAAVLGLGDALKALSVAGVELGALQGVADFLSGPWGIALAAAGMAIGMFVSTTNTASQSVDGLTAALDKDNGAIGTNTAAWISNKLEQEGALKSAEDLGVSSTDVASALVVQGTALDNLRTKLQGIVNADLTKQAATQGDQWTGSMSATGTEAQKLLDTINSLSGGVKDQIDAYHRQQDATKGATEALTQQEAAADAVSNNDIALSGSTKQVSDALSAAKQSATDLQNALELLNGGNIDAEKANLSFKDSIDTVTKSIQKGKDAINDNTDAGRSNIKTILDAVSAAQTHAEAVAKQTESVDAGNQAFNADVKALQDVLRKAGLTEDQIKSLTDTYMRMPPLHLDTPGLDSATQKLQTITATINGIPTYKQVTVSVDYQSVNNRTMSATGGLIRKFAGGGDVGVLHRDFGGPVAGEGTESSDSIPAMLSDNEYVIRARAADSVGTGVLDALNAGDLDTVYRLLGQRSDVHTDGASIDMSELAGALSAGGSQQPVVIVNITPQGSILAANDLRQMVQDVVLKYAARNSSAGWTPRFV